MSRFLDLSGQRFGRLTAIEPEVVNGKRLWKCLCDCGNETHVVTNKLRSGHTKSCSCLQKDKARKTRTSHGRSKTSLYVRWMGIKARCYNPKNIRYMYYGGRGITMADEWFDYETFHDWAYKNGYEPHLQIDRINNDKGYSPENCRWVTRTVNIKNTSVCILHGELSTSEWFEQIGEENNLSKPCIIYRYYKLKQLGIEPTEENILAFLSIAR